MPSKSTRRLVCVMPVESINGKILPTKDKLTDPEARGFVGYQNSWSVANRFRCYNKPIPVQSASASQIAARNAFKTTLTQVQTIMQDPSQRQQYASEWKSKPEGYVTLRGYIFAKVHGT